jgi:hypothetical protein
MADADREIGKGGAQRSPRDLILRQCEVASEAVRDEAGPVYLSVYVEPTLAHPF